MEPTKLFEIFEEVAHAEQRPGEMVSRYATVKIRDLVDGAIFDAAENKGLYALDGHIIVQPKYQRFYIYGDGKRDVKVIDSILKGRPIGMISLYLPGDLARDGVPMAEVLDGQQRLTTIIRFCTEKFSVEIDGNPFNFYALPKEMQDKILDTEIPASICTGGEQMRNDWFKTINMPGVALTNMETLNCVYSGEQVEALKEIFSRVTPYISHVALQYIKGDPMRQEIEEIAIKMVCPDVEAYLAEHRHDTDVSAVEKKFHAVLDWADRIFPEYYREMKGLEWGRLYDEYHDKFFNSEELGKMVSGLMADEHVTAKKGVFEYALQKVSGVEPDLSLLHIRLFEESTKRTVFSRQTSEAKANGVSNCPMCAQLQRTTLYGIKEMDADHATAWSKGGSTDISNCVMLCTTHNRMKGNR
ncbi:MAG: DUF262 domain-containing protein [Fibrobacter sp.]|nr:DUF262 domain-containing protein [Fibrobacter sp.]